MSLLLVFLPQRRPEVSSRLGSSAASEVYKGQALGGAAAGGGGSSGYNATSNTLIYTTDGF